MQRHASRLAGECGIRLPVDLHSTTARLSGSTELAEVSVTPSAHFGPCKLSKSNHAIDMSSIYMYRLSMMICQVFACGLLHSKLARLECRGCVGQKPPSASGTCRLPFGDPSVPEQSDTSNTENLCRRGLGGRAFDCTTRETNAFSNIMTLN